MKFKYRTVYIDSIEGQRRAERLVALGWKIILVASRYVLLEKGTQK